jgi:2,5-diketo-D-gluconate reductase A
MHDVSAGGVSIPSLGFGTWQIEGDAARQMVERAIEAGYRHIDTAQIYGNEAEVGAAIAASGVPRDEFFVTTKVWTACFSDGDLQNSVQESLERLKLDRVDLLLLHWPKPAPALEETMTALNDVRQRGWTRSIGLSNFTVALMDKAQSLSAAPLATNQVEYHPYLSQNRLLAAAARLGSSITAWSPMARGRITGDPVLTGIGAAYDKTPGQVALRWLVQQPGVIAIPQTSNPDRLKQNIDIFDFHLTDQEMATISAMGSPQGRTGDWLDKAYQWDAG